MDVDVLGMFRTLSAFAPTRRRRVLVVDSEPLVRSLVGTILERDGFEVVAEASDEHAAVELARRLQPDFVLLDLGRPGVGGREAVAELGHVAPATQVVVMTFTPTVTVDPELRRDVAMVLDKAHDLTHVADNLSMLLDVG